MKKALSFCLKIITEKDHDGEYFAYSPDFEGVLAGGYTEEEALKNFKKLFKEYIITLIKHGRPIPFSHNRKIKKLGAITENIEIGQLIGV